MAEYKIEKYDCDALKEARRQIKKVLEYHFCVPGSQRLTRRLETIIVKIDYLLSYFGDEK